MNLLPQHLREDFERVAKNIPTGEIYSLPSIGYYEILKAHYFISDYFEQQTSEASLYGVRDFNLLGSAVGRQITGYGGKDKWKSPYEISATLFFGLTKNHAFHDGNKRTALLSLIYQLFRNNFYITATKVELEKLTVAVAEGSLDSYKEFKQFKKRQDSKLLFLADFIRRKTRRINRNYRSLTYSELNAKLKNFGCYLDNPSGNFINVYKKETRKTFWVIGPQKEEIKRVLQIGFPGWKKQINLKAFRETLKALNLTPEDGVDSEVFFQGAEPLYRIIEEYEVPLKRLKDK